MRDGDIAADKVTGGLAPGGAFPPPRILMLDEGTSHLDLENERAVNAALSQLAITRLVVAHRPETLRAAQRVITLEGGVAREAGGVLHQQQEMMI